jgi:2',5'-phosphodiesterase
MKVLISLKIFKIYLEIYFLAYSTLIKDFNYQTPIELSTFSNYAYTNYMLKYHEVIDHIFFDGKKFQFQRAIPMPTHEEVTEFSALPSCKIPSDHLAVVVELEKMK